MAIADDQNLELLTLRGPWRATLALALHIGFFVLPAGLVLGLAGIAVLTFRYETGSGARAALAAVLVGVVLAMGLRTVLRASTRPRGVPIDERTQPQLWKLVDAVARAADTEAPEEIRLTSEPHAGIRQDSTLLGLRARRRYLEIGLPLIAGLNVSELRATMAYEIGHLAGGRLKPWVYRATLAVEHTASTLTGGPTKWLFAGYAGLFTALAAPVNRGLELEADALAVQVAGKRTAMTALRKITGLELAWRDFSDDYLGMATTVERTPDLLLGFRSFLEHPQRKAQIAERAKQTIAEEQPSDHRGERHSTIRTRVEEMKRLPASDREPDTRPAWALLRNPSKSVPALEDQLMVDGLGHRVPWPEMARLAGAAHVSHQAAVLSSAVAQSGVCSNPSLGGVLAALHHGHGRDLINPVLNPGLNPDRVSQAADDTLTELLGAAVVDALVRAGHARHELNWGGPSHVVLGNGQPLDPDRLVRPAVTDPRLIPGLHRALVGLGVPLQHAQPPAKDPEPSVSGLVSSVEHAGTRNELLVTDRGLLLVPSRSTRAQRLLAGVLTRARRAENEQLAELADTPIAELRDRPDTQWVDSRDVATARWLQQSWGWSLTLALYLDEYSVSELDEAGTTTTEDGTVGMELRSTADSEERDDPYGGLGELMGARMTVRGHEDQDE